MPELDDEAETVVDGEKDVVTEFDGDCEGERENVGETVFDALAQ